MRRLSFTLTNGEVTDLESNKIKGVWIFAVILVVLAVLALPIHCAYVQFIFPLRCEHMQKTHYVTHIGGYKIDQLIGTRVYEGYTDADTGNPYCSIKPGGNTYNSLLMKYDEDGTAVGAYFWPTYEWTVYGDPDYDDYYEAVFTGYWVYVEFSEKTDGYRTVAKATVVATAEDPYVVAHRQNEAVHWPHPSRKNPYSTKTK